MSVKEKSRNFRFGFCDINAFAVSDAHDGRRGRDETHHGGNSHRDHNGTHSSDNEGNCSGMPPIHNRSKPEAGPLLPAPHTHNNPPEVGNKPVLGHIPGLVRLQHPAKVAMATESRTRTLHLHGNWKPPPAELQIKEIIFSYINQTSTDAYPSTKSMFF